MKNIERTRRRHPATMDYKQTIIEQLDIMRKKEQQNREPFKARAYAKVIASLREFDGAVRDIADVEGLPGVGKKIREKIIEIIANGTLAAAQRVAANDDFKAMEELSAVYGIGTVKARELVEAGITGIDALRVAVAEEMEKNGKINIINDKQYIGLTYHEDIIKRIPRKEMQKHEQIITSAAAAVDPRMSVQIVGSYRRGLADSGDIDALVSFPADVAEKTQQEVFVAFVKKLATGKTAPYIVENLAEGKKKYMGIVRAPRHKTHRRLDLLLTPRSEFATALLYFTGSQAFNIKMRAHAVALGYTLNEHALTRVADGVTEPPATFADEEAIFAFLKLRYVPPLGREAAGKRDALETVE